MSSTFVYNTMNKIDQGAIELLQYPFVVQDGTKARKNSSIHQLMSPCVSNTKVKTLWTLKKKQDKVLMFTEWNEDLVTTQREYKSI